MLVVVAILAILAAALLPRLLPYSHRAREVALSKDMRTLSTVVEVWAAQNGDYPTPSTDLEDTNSIISVMKDHGINWTGDESGIVDPWGNPYVYDVVIPD